MDRSVSKIEYAKALKSIKAITSISVYEEVFNIVVPLALKDEIEKSISGLSEEDEFAALTKLICNPKIIIELGQKPIVKNEYAIPDFLVEYNIPFIGETEKGACPSTIYLVEVKSTKKDQLSFGAASLAKLRNISLLLNVPLLFAVRFILPTEHMPIWNFYLDDTLKSKMSFSRADQNQLNKIIWNDYTIKLKRSTKFIYRTTRSIPVKKSVIIGEYGTIVDVSLEVGGKVFKKKGPTVLIDTLIFECFDLSVLSVKPISTTDFLLTLEPRTFSISLSKLIIMMNLFLVDDDGRKSFVPLEIMSRCDRDIFDYTADRKLVEMHIGDLIYSDLIEIEK